jgi:Transposase
VTQFMRGESRQPGLLGGRVEEPWSKIGVPQHAASRAGYTASQTRASRTRRFATPRPSGAVAVGPFQRSREHRRHQVSTDIGVPEDLARFQLLPSRKPFYYLLEDADFGVMLVNARHVKNLPGRKSDVSDAAWLAQLGAQGLARGGFVPPAPIRELRDLTRARTAMTRERGREIQRLEKLLEDAGIKLSSVASDITCLSGRLMLQALIDGQRDPAVLADLAKRRLRAKIPELTEALTGRFSDHHAFLTGMYLDAIDQRSRQIAELTARIEVVIEPFSSRRLLATALMSSLAPPALHPSRRCVKSASVGG